jgi:hypothetical protein
MAITRFTFTNNRGRLGMKTAFSWCLLFSFAVHLHLLAQDLAPQADTKGSLAVPSKMSYQGVLTDNNIWANGGFRMTFGLYTTPNGGNPLWSETQNSVQVENGIFNVFLGSVNPIDLPFDVTYYLNVSVEGTNLEPRIELASSGYSFNTARIQGRSVSSTLPSSGQVLKWTGSEWAPGADETTGGTAGGDLIGTYPNPTVAAIRGRTVSSTTPSSGQVLKWTGSQWAPGTDETGAGGGVQSVTASSPISSSGGTNPNISLSSSGITSTYLASNSVTTGKIQDGAITGSKLSLPFSTWASTSGPAFQVFTSNTSGTAIRGDATASSGFAVGVVGVSNSSGGNGVRGLSYHTTSNDNYGVYGWSAASSSFGIYGEGGQSGVYGKSWKGVEGESNSTGAAGVVAHSYNSGITHGIMAFQNSTSASARAGYFSGNLQYTGSLISPSDASLKTNIQPVSPVLAKLTQLQPHTFSFGSDSRSRQMGLPQGTQYGLIAEEIETIFPELVVESTHLSLQRDANGNVPESFNYKGLKYIELIPILIQAIKEQQQIIDDLKAHVEELRNR